MCNVGGGVAKKKKHQFHCARCGSPCQIYKKGTAHRVLICPQHGILAVNPGLSSLLSSSNLELFKTLATKYNPVYRAAENLFTQPPAPTEAPTLQNFLADPLGGGNESKYTQSQDSTPLPDAGSTTTTKTSPTSARRQKQLPPASCDSHYWIERALSL